MSSLKTRLLMVPALFLSLPLVLAQAPSGPVDFYFDRTTYPVWDFSGPYTFSQKIVAAGGSTIDLIYAVNLTQSLSGSLKGEGTTMVTIGNEVLAATFKASGSVSLGGNSTQVRLNVSLSGAGLDAFGGQNRKFSAKLSYDLRVDPDPNNAPAWIAPASGVPVRGSISVAGLGGSTIIPAGDPSTYSIPLPPGIDGSWSCLMDVVSIGQHIGGTATIAVDSYAQADNPVGIPITRVMTTNIKAKYNASNNQAQVVLTGLPGSTPTSLQVYFTAGAAHPSKVSGKILGQTIK